MKEEEKYQYWHDKGEKRGIPYSIEELILKYRINKIFIRCTLVGLLAILGFLTWLIGVSS